MKKYEEYRESGIVGLGEIPSHWFYSAFKRLMVGLKDGTHGSFDRVSEGHMLLSAKNVHENGLRTDTIQSLISEKDFLEITKNGFPQKGDILLTIVGTIGRCSVYSLDYPLAFQRSVSFLRLKQQQEPTFYHYFIQSKYYQEQLVSVAKTSAQSGVYLGDIGKSIVVVPPLPEQRAIAAYLDRKTAQLDTLLAQKEALLRMLHQKRQALINEAVTQGLDPAAPRKPSGVAWLGDVPAHWEVKKLKYVMDFFNTVRVPLSAEERGLMTNPMYDYYGASGAIDKVDNYHFDGEYILLAEDGANLLSRSSPLAFKATGKFWVNNHAHILRPKDGNLDYYINLLESLDYTIYVTGSAQPKLTMGNLANVSLPVPPVQEQHEIQKYLHRISSQLMSVENQIHTQIQTLKAYRQSLISEVVTGKVDVRPAALASAAAGTQTQLWG